MGGYLILDTVSQCIFMKISNIQPKEFFGQLFFLLLTLLAVLKFGR